MTWRASPCARSFSRCRSHSPGSVPGIPIPAGIPSELENGPDDVVVDFYDSRVADHSGLEAIDAEAKRYLRAGKSL